MCTAKHITLLVGYCSLYTKTYIVFLVNDVFYVEVIQCVSKVDESRRTALLECSKLDYDVEDVVCVLPSETVDCK